LEPCTFKPHCCPNPPERNIAHSIEDALAADSLRTVSIQAHVPAKTRLFIDYMVEQLG
jgi:hypothetical protein